VKNCSLNLREGKHLLGSIFSGAPESPGNIAAQKEAAKISFKDIN
jgi:hypothetical protein